MSLLTEPLRTKIDLSQKYDKIFFVAQQYEGNSRTLEIEITHDRMPYIIPEGIDVYIQVEDRVFKKCEVSDNVISIVFNKAMCAVDGVMDAKLLFTGMDGVLYSTLFKYRVEGGLVDPNTIIPEEDVKGVLEALVECADVTARCENLIKVIEEEEAIRANKETLRDIKEQERQDNETTRQEYEKIREDNELERQGEESARKNNEEARIENEIERQTTLDAMVELLDRYNELGIPTFADANPKMDGEATPGTSNDMSRADHVHPTDTSRAPVEHTHSIEEIAGSGTFSADVLPVVPIEKGGTAATTVDDALTNLHLTSDSETNASIKVNSITMGNGVATYDSERNAWKLTFS